MIMFLVILVILVALGVLITLMGVRIRNNGMRPIVQSEVEADGQRLTTSKDGRQVAYCTYGSLRQ